MIIIFCITGGEDYELGPLNVTILAGHISVSFNISIIDDIIFEQNEFFTLTIDSSSLPNGVSVQPDCMLMITIMDDDGKLYTYTFQIYFSIFLSCSSLPSRNKMN